MSTPDSLEHALRGRRFGLVLSAGYFGFFGHSGLIEALEERGLAPTAWAGTSAGALVAGLGAAGFDAARMASLMDGVTRADFWDPAPLRLVWEGLSGRGATGLLAGRRFRALLDRHLGDRTIESCRDPLVIVTSDVSAAAPRVHTRGSLAHAVHASCAYPGLFRTVDDGGAQLWDGGLIDKAPLVALTERVPALEALLVMYLPSDTKARAIHAPRRHGYVGGLAQGLAAVRHEHYVLQAKLCEARGVPVYELSPTLVPLGPTKLALGPRARSEARQFAELALSAPAAHSRPFPSS